MKIDQSLLDQLTSAATTSHRLRMNKDLRNSELDNSQRMLNAIEPNSVLPIHRHTSTSETVIILRGSAEQLFFDDNGNINERVFLKPESECVGLSVEKGRWHKIIALEPGTVIFESKDGAYEPISQQDILTL